MKALVTNCTRNSGVAVMQALHQRAWQVHGADDRVPPWGLHARCAAGPYALLPAEDNPRFGAALLKLLDELRPDVLIPTRGVGAACSLAAQQRIASATLLPDVEAYELCNDKSRLLALCKQLHVPVPQRHSLEEGLRLLRSGARQVLVVRPCKDVGGGEGVNFVETAEQLATCTASVIAAYGDALITDLIEGPTTSLRALHLLFDADTRLIGSFVMRKTRIWPPRRGISVAAESTDENELVELVLPIFKALRWRGAADVELKLDERDGTPRLLEINPRFSGAIAFSIACGIDMPGRYCEAALGKRLPEITGCESIAGRRYVDPARWVAAAWHERHTRGNFGRALREWRDRVPHTGSSDPAARFAKLALSLRRFVSHA
ncbi:MAG: ATP-grasp domain-containing protein [Steroidobacteraceae bacterium]